MSENSLEKYKYNKADLIYPAFKVGIRFLKIPATNKVVEEYFHLG